MRVLPSLIGLKGQFFNPIKDLLLRRGLRRVACFCHGCSHLGGFLDRWGWGGAMMMIIAIAFAMASCRYPVSTETQQSPYGAAMATAAFDSFSVSFHCRGQWGIAVDVVIR